MGKQSNHKYNQIITVAGLMLLLVPLHLPSQLQCTATHCNTIKHIKGYKKYNKTHLWDNKAIIKKSNHNSCWSNALAATALAFSTAVHCNPLMYNAPPAAP